MNRRVCRPQNQVRLTNVAVIRMKKSGKRFEIACYKNKVLNWRNGVETDLSEVLQSEIVFTNVSKGIAAKQNDLEGVFGANQTPQQICRRILTDGELQVSEGERKHQTISLYRDIATIVADKCVNPESNRPYPFSVIERVMKDIHYSVIPNRSAKQQALEVIKILKKHIPIARAKMKIQISVPIKDGKKVKSGIIAEQAAISAENWDGEFVKFVCLIDPGVYRALDSLVQTGSHGLGSLEVLEFSCSQEGEHNIDDELTGENNASIMSQSINAKKSEDQHSSTISTTVSSPEKKGLRCSTCGTGKFGSDRQKYREHFRSDWHRYNLKMKNKQLDVVDEDSFGEIGEEELAEFFGTLDT